MKISVKVYRILAKVLLALMILALIGILVFLGLHISGKSSLYKKSGNNMPDLSGVLTDTRENAEEDLSEEGTALQVTPQPDNWQEGDVRYEGIHYRYNEEILTFLFLGIDKMGPVKDAKNGIDGGQSDAIFLLVLNPKNKEASVIGVNRDTMTEIQVYSKGGNYLGTTTAQLTLQHGYGDGKQLSCERSVQAVSKLFYNLPIHGYCAINMGAIPLINDAVGGVELTVPENVQVGQKLLFKEGETIRLKGQEAYKYIQVRDVNSFESAGRRLDRQKQYLSAYAKTAMEAMKEDVTLPVTLYNTLSKYMVTDISIDEVSYLAPQVREYHFGNDTIYSLAGETVMGENYEEFYVEDKALYELILQVFYETVED